MGSIWIDQSNLFHVVWINMKLLHFMLHKPAAFTLVREMNHNFIVTTTDVNI